MTLTTTNTFYPEEFNRRVLLIDDNAAIIEDFRKVLTFDNDSELSNLSDRLFGTAGTEKKKAQQPHPVFQVDAALRGEDGYEMVAKGVASGQPYAMAFVDMRMPMGWDGLKTIQQLWSVDPHLEVVICTAYSDYTWDDMIQGLEQQDHLLLLKKPFEPIEVCQLCLSLTEKWNLSRIARLKMEEMNALVESKTAEVIEANKAKSRFLNILGHEFLTPLNGVLGFAQVLRSQHGEDMDDQAINCLDYIEISGEKLHQLVSDLLDFVSSTSGHLSINPVPHSADELVDYALINFTRQSESHMVKYQHGMVTEPVMADMLRCNQIFLNLLHNAQKYSPGHEPLEILVSKQDQVVRFEVKDVGAGMDETKIRQLLRPIKDLDKEPAPAFSLDKSSNEGLGMGLPFAKHLVEMQGGEIGINSIPGEGTSVWFTLPLVKKN